MNGKGIAWLCVFVFAAVAGSAGVLLAERWDGDRRAPASEEFQRLVHGLGLGPALDLSECEPSFDARQCAGCNADYWPVPGSLYFCRHHACSILHYREPLAPVETRTGESR